MTIDGKTLDELDALHAAATPGPWRVETVPTSIGCCHTIRGGWPTRTWINEEREAYACIYDDGRYVHHPGGKLHANAVAIVAEHNALPHLTSRVRELEAQLAAAREDTARLDWLQEQEVDTIYLDDGRIMDVRGGGVRARIDAARVGQEQSE